MVTLDGSMAGSGAASWKAAAQAGAAPTLLSLRVTQSGSLTWTLRSMTTSCAISLTTTKDGDRLRSTGTVCGQTVDQSVPLGPR